MSLPPDPPLLTTTNKLIFEKKLSNHIRPVQFFYTFEYPEAWVLDQTFHNSGFGWNELYLLKAFLMYNDAFEIILFNTYLEHAYEEWFKLNMPLCLKNRGGSIWLRKIK